LNERHIDIYLSTIHTLWPGEPEPRLRRSRGSGHPSGRDRVEWLVLPNAGSPRILVPAHNPAAAARAMLRFSAALSAPDTVKRLGVSTLLRGGARAAFPDRIAVEERAGSLTDHLADVFGEPVDVSLGLGTARTNRKPVLQVFDTRGRSIAFVKIGGTPVTETLVQAEVASLRRLGAADLPRLFEVPRLLHAGRWEGSALVAMTALATSFRQRPSRQYDVPVDAMTLFHEAFGEGTRPLVEMPLWDSMRSAQASLQPSEARERLGEALTVLGETDVGRPLSMGGWHGDWTPWNMSRRRHRLQLWDWERFESGVPLGMDRCHYAVNAVCRRDGVDVGSVMAGLDLAGVHNDRSTEAHVVGATYLAAITCRYLQGAEFELGDAIAGRSLVMLDALCAWLGMPAGVRHG
jgi:hypothetical protein